MENLKIIGYGIAGFLVLVFTVIGVTATFTGSSANGIHPIGENAVYIAGEVCTINAGLERTNDEILSEARDCVELHGAYRTLDYFDKKNAGELVAGIDPTVAD